VLDGSGGKGWRSAAAWPPRRGTEGGLQRTRGLLARGGCGKGWRSDPRLGGGGTGVAVA